VKRLKTAACGPDSLTTATDGSPETEDEGDEYNEQELLRLGYTDKGNHALSALSELLQGTQKEPRPLGTQVSCLSQGMESQYWAIVNALPAAPLVQALVQVFFDEVNWYFAVLDQCFFDILFVEWTSMSRGIENIQRLTPTVLYFPALLFQVLALALQFLPPNQSNELSLRERNPQEIDVLSARLSGQGEKLMRLLGRRAPNVTSVQADMMCCAWQKNDGRGADSWHSLSNATRQAQEIGLHLNSDQDTDTQSTNPDTLKRLWFDEHKRRLWATLVTWESHMSLQLGRPRLIHLTDCTCLDPIDCDFPVSPSQTVFRPARPDERPSLYTTQLVKYKIGQTIHRMMSIGATNPLLQNYDVVESLHSVVLELLGSLPQAMKLENPDVSWDARLPGLVKARFQIAIVVHSFLLALHRPHASRFETSRQRATQAAIGSLEASDKLFQLTEPHQYKIHTIVFHTIDSGIFLAIAAIKYYTHESHTRGIIDQTLERAIERLKILKSRNSIARHGEKALVKCVRKFRQAWSHQVVSSMSFAPESRVGAQPLLLGSETRRYDIGETSGPLSGSSSTDIEHDPLLSRDLFEDITNSRVSTSSWLEHMDMMFKLDFRFDESDFSWDDFFT
jgi:hypothetical protein